MIDSPYFVIDEFFCSCCRQQKMDYQFLELIVSLRHYSAVPMRINSGWRCEPHNRAIGGSLGSFHLVGRAVDVHCVDSSDRFKLVKYGSLLGLSIRIYDSFLHLDNRKKSIITRG